MFTKTLAVAALAAVASAQIPAVARRDFIEARQTDSVSLDATCQTAIASILPLYSELPTVPADLASATLPSDPCATPSFTGSLSSEYASYTSDVLEWYSSNSAVLLSALAECTALSAYASDVPVCASGAVTATGATTAATTDSGSGSSSATVTGTNTASGSGSSATVSKNLAPRETGFVAAAVAAAGLLAGIAAL